MKLIERAKQLIPCDIVCHEISLAILFNASRLPAPAFWPESKGSYESGIIVPDLRVEDSIEAMIKSVPDDPCMIPALENLLKQNHIIAANEVMNPHLYASFSILHELGHWYHFQENYTRRGLNGQKYITDYKEIQLKLELEKIGELAKKAKKGSQEQIELLSEYHKLYRKHPFEIIADQFAIGRLKEQMK
ncbi:hypothetical protein GC093_16895 [Paenibacillus sp. LMG 31456]|uniref:Uncharacterized protein n=1 Tax=Paenibacillus foliorum TaxID=2654974 RepID=A0A972GQ74_9BACL|nr:hypothetical protein [Paenibacillus foliorum]NOU94886.1 hypothetical protein [Paenibacillus foliorum]